MIGHVGDANDTSYALTLLKTGCYVAVDRIAPHNATFATELVKAGCEDRIFLSHDHICCRDNVLESVSQGEPYGLDAVHSRVLPEMRTLGVTEETLRKITVENVCHLFG